MNTNRILMVVAIAALVGTGIWFQQDDAMPNPEIGGKVGDVDAEQAGASVERAGSSERGRIGHREPTGARRAGPQPVSTRPVSSHAQLDWEGGEPDDWDELDSQGRIDRTDTKIEALKTQIAATSDPNEKEMLEEQALQTLAFARADFFLTPETTNRYLELEASLGG